ncbi:MAG: histidine kinase dimerization/phosphoacceptor domain -containing protein [Methanobacteriaceae archaeon]|jgi:two-component sensor histidine kinase|nr:histidine kinase dimerization/phosphoacceptor domain -containing protein [Methanobacteriaceae archaeon]MDO9626423.1 histidine kinase dimerization/phosphoacceptor domain -containing protein [Methanobacteriaceae archaeon]
MAILINRDGTISFRNASIISLLILIIFTITILFFRNDTYIKSAFSDIITPLINLLAVISLLYAAKLSKVYGKRVYLAWLILGIGQLFFTLGDISWGYIELYLNQSPIFSISDIFYLAYYPLFVLGIFLLPRAHFNRLDLSKIVLDILVVGITTAMLLWTFLIVPLFTNVEGNLPSAYLFLSYVILDFMLLFALLDLIYSRINSIKENTLFLLAAGVFFQIISDIFFIYQTIHGTFESGSLIDIGWISGFLLIGLAGILQINASIQKRNGNPDKSKNKTKEAVIRPEWTSYLPFIWIILAYLTFAWSYHQKQLTNLETVIWVGTLIIALVIIRQIISFREIRQLYNSAEDEILKRVKAEEKIKESLEEKEVLLKEIHHRVKNNMQIISSILSLQSRQITDPETINIFKESQSRVKSMSMIHERLYKSENLSSINFGEYINSLSLDLLGTYASNPDLIELNINAEKIEINIDTVIPCGLILTELVSNAFKYAFPEERKGKITIDFYKERDLFTLKVSDNGVGLPKSLDYKNTKSLGLLLVNSLINQIDGDLTLETSEGTTFIIKFKEITYKNRS